VVGRVFEEVNMTDIVTIKIVVEDHGYNPPVSGVRSFTKKEFLKGDVDFTVVVVGLLKQVESVRKDINSASRLRVERMYPILPALQGTETGRAEVPAPRILEVSKTPWGEAELKAVTEFLEKNDGR
jgi:hypothetical protein